MAGVDANGFSKKVPTEILDEIETSQKGSLGAALDVGSDNPLGQMNGIMATKLGEIHELIEVAYNAFDPDKVEDAIQDALCALTGTVRAPAEATKVFATLSITGTITVPAGSKVSIDGRADLVFDLEEDVVSTGSGDYPGTFICETLGPVTVNTGTLTEIITPVAGWDSVTNDDPVPGAGGELGSDVETSTDLRARRDNELVAQGSSSLDATVEAVREVEDVLEVQGFENTSLVTDSDGLPGKSFEIVVWDDDPPQADEDVIGQTIWDHKPSGIETYGSISTDVEDLDGNPRTVLWSRATALDLYLEFDIVKTDDYAGDDALKEAVVARVKALQGIGDDVIALALKYVPLTLTGVIDVPTLALDFVSSPTNEDNLTVGSREIAVLDVNNIDINYV